MSALEQWGFIYFVGLTAIVLTADLSSGWRVVLAWSIAFPVFWWIGEKSPFARRWRRTHPHAPD
jgi:hypothetical protein